MVLSPIDSRGYRRPPTPKEIADLTVSTPIGSWNAALSNGNFRSAAGAAGAPDGVNSFYGTVETYDAGHGRQSVAALGASDLEYVREFYLSGSSVVFGAWLKVGGTVLTGDWNVTTKNGNFRSVAAAIGAPDTTNAFYGYVVNYDDSHGVQRLWAVGATTTQFEREFFLVGAAVTFGAWREVYYPDGIMEKGGSASAGYYVKYFDGRLECYISSDQTSVAWSTAYGSLYGPADPFSWVFPVAFTASPNVQASAARYGLKSPHGCTPYGVGFGNVDVLPWGVVNSPAGTGKSLAIVARGFWK